MKIVVGLGNPGPEYARTRHNVGFMVLDRLAALHAPGAVQRQRFQAMTVEAMLPARDPRDWDEAAGRWTRDRAAKERVLLMKPMTYMNLSGRSVSEAVRFFKIDPSSSVLVVVDEVALPCGALRLRGSGSSGGHNGLADIERLLGTDAYDRCRIGIDPPGRVPQRDYVLGRFTEEQVPAIERGIERACAAVELWASEGVMSAGNVFNAKKARRERGPGPSERAMRARGEGKGGEGPDSDGGSGRDGADGGVDAGSRSAEGSSE
ncbi:MAG: aminoacyl-tRNA hydrolase [Phycisphaerales bacterium]